MRLLETPVKALVFDVFGTVVDWRSSVALEVQQLAKRKGVDGRRAKFADAWRAGYGPSMNRVRTGELPWTKLDALHRMTLDRILVDFKLTVLSEEEKDALNHAWHRLRPWPDSVAGLTRLKKKFIIAPLSNGNIALMTDLAKHAGLPWDCILGAELVRHYKPDREVYQSAADFLNLAPGRRDDGGRAPGRSARREGRRAEDRRSCPVRSKLRPGGKPDLKGDASVDVGSQRYSPDGGDLARSMLRSDLNATRAARRSARGCSRGDRPTRSDRSRDACVRPTARDSTQSVKLLEQLVSRERLVGTAAITLIGRLRELPAIGEIDFDPAPHLVEPCASISASNTVSTRGIIACTGADATNSSVNSRIPARRRRTMLAIMNGRQNFASSSVFAVL